MITRYNFRIAVRLCCRTLPLVFAMVAGCASPSIEMTNGIAGAPMPKRIQKIRHQNMRVQPSGVERSANAVVAANATSELAEKKPADDLGNYFHVARDVRRPLDENSSVVQATGYFEEGELGRDGPVIVDPVIADPVVERPVVERVGLAAPMVVQQPTEELVSEAVVQLPVAPPEIELKADEIAEVEEVFPVDLPTALQLAGANSLQVALAVERLSEAYTRVEQADVRWLPSVRVGFSYNRHNGRNQATDGTIVEASRGSFFAGGGVGSGTAPLNGGAGGPPRFAVDLSLAEIVFEPLAARRVVEVVTAEHNATFNETLLEAGTAYLRLVTAQAQLNTLGEIRKDVERMVEVAEAFASAGEGKVADVQRAMAELARWEHAEFGRQEEVRVASIELARILRLEPGTLLNATDSRLMSWSFFEDESADQLIAQAVAARPEMSRATAQTRVASANIAQEHWRPYLPHLLLGFSGGAFGGDRGSQWKNVSDRTDIDVAAIWEMENLGWGNAARRELAANRHRQACIAVDMTRDRIISQVVAANQRCRIRQASIQAAQTRLDAAAKSMEAALLGIREGVQRPVEAQQSVVAVADARLAYLDAISSYNQAQLQLLYAVGTPASESRVVSVREE